ncbi:hypothetical protein [Paramuribaculum intestinale]|nr:hypothetical protein [Paramuribaculum intestinale]
MEMNILSTFAYNSFGDWMAESGYGDYELETLGEDTMREIWMSETNQ